MFEMCSLLNIYFLRIFSIIFILQTLDLNIINLGELRRKFYQMYLSWH